MFSYELARRLDGTGVTANVLHPGVVRTGFGAEDPGRFAGLLVPVARLFMKTPERGAATSVYLASSPEVEGVTGGYIDSGRSRDRQTLRGAPGIWPPGSAAPSCGSARTRAIFAL
jgi:retinol dehydrogenase 14